MSRHATTPEVRDPRGSYLPSRLYSQQLAGGTRATPSLSELLALSPEALERQDIAVLNLRAAKGLPGAEALDVASCLTVLDRWAHAVGRFTADHAGEYDRNPDAYSHSRAVFCFLSMVTLLKHPRGIGLQYQPTAIGNFDFLDSRDDLLHGLLTRKMGTCASLPVLFVAIGRRLGWPMYLALAKRHILCQWAGPEGGRTNLEGSCPGGGETYPDAHYASWPYPLSADELASGVYLRPLTAAESFAEFLNVRGHCLADNGRFDEAAEAYVHAHRLAPQTARYGDHIVSLAVRERNGRNRDLRPCL